MKKQRPFSRLMFGTALALVSLYAGFAESRADENSFSWKRTDASIALFHDGHVLWQFNYGPDDAKPSFHPLNTFDGVTLTCYRPEDHRWHRALWFSWKFINGLNYWEEDPETGASEGVTEIISVKATLRDDYSARIEIRLGYHPPGEKEVLSEKRVIQVDSPSLADGHYDIQWHSLFQSGDEAVVLDRTPIEGEPNGVSWGGYAGLSVRISPDLLDWTVIDSASRKDLQVNRRHADWVDFQGRHPEGNRLAGIRIFDHPDNPRHPTPWYVIMGRNPAFGYLSPALLYYEPYRMRPHSRLDLRYRIRVHSKTGP